MYQDLDLRVTGPCGPCIGCMGEGGKVSEDCSPERYFR